MNSVDLPCLLLQHRALMFIGIFQGRLEIIVSNDGIIGGAVAGRNLGMRFGIIDIFDAVFAKDQTSIGLG